MRNRLSLIMISVCLSLSGISDVNSSTKYKSYPDLFQEVVKIVENNFYNPAQIAQNFPTIKETYRKQLKHISSHDAFTKIVNNMLGELNASHTYYLTPDDYEYYHLGALFSKIPEIGALFGGQ